MPPRLRLATAIVRVLRKHGHLALLVGGCVRDRLLGIQPKDYDVATSAAPGQITSIFPRAQLVGAHFGVLLISNRRGAHVEVATFRSEGEYSDGRHPGKVAFVLDPALDAKRRDFTINGLFQDPRNGEVFDYVNGRVDLEHRLVRAIGDPDQRFREDHLRMLRAVRFAARLEFDLEVCTLASIRAHAASIKLISAERIRDELVYILTQGHVRYAMELLDSTGLLAHILPEVKAFQGVEQPPEFHPEGDVWSHVLLMLDQLKNPSPTLALGVLLHDVAKPATFRRADRIRFDGHAELGVTMAAQILRRLKFSKDEIEQVSSLVANHMKFKDVRQMRLSTLKRFLRLPDFQEHLEMHRLDCLASNGYTDAHEFVRSKLQEFEKVELRPQSLVNGKDLIAAGYTPGPRFKQALALVETAQLDGEIESKEQALALIQRVMGRA